MTPPEPPMGLLAELTHRCPLACPYCSNPVHLTRAGAELDSAAWLRVIDEAADLGVLQIHLSGGEPAVRAGLAEITARAAARGIYTNLITSGVLLDAASLAELRAAGLDHVQLSVQDSRAAQSDAIGGYAGGHTRKQAFAERVRAASLPLTVNAVVHRQNLDRLPEIIELAVEMGAGRLEIAHAQYHGWAQANRAALMPTPTQVDAALDTVEAARSRLDGTMAIDHVLPDYDARYPKACMGGWGQRILVVTPAGKVLPCHAAESIPELSFETVHDRPLAAIWRNGPAFARFRGTAWMPEPCRSCERREIDFGGCRCQALAFTGDAANTDPACALSPYHDRLCAAAEQDAQNGAAYFAYRGFAAQPRRGTVPET